MKKNIEKARLFILAALIFMCSACTKVSESVVVLGGEEEEELPEVTESIDDYFKQPSASFLTYEENVLVKGIYVTGNIAGIDAYFDPLVEITKNTAINAMVVDIKNDKGIITTKGIEAADTYGTAEKLIPDINAFMEKLYANNIYPIARIVVFKDPKLPELKPEFAVKNPDGSVFRDKKGEAWVNPYNKEVWKYIVDVSKAAAGLGFKEIQFDYIRFSTDAKMKDADLGPLALEKSRTDIITEFTEYAYNELSPLGVKVSADVFGTIIDSKIDADIVGQDYIEMSKILDVICPMVYPSHYSNNSMEIDYPDLKPYDTIYKSMSLSNEKLQDMEGNVVVRPWLQAFTATWVNPHQTYGAAQIEEQIKGAFDAGIEEFLFWDASCRYNIDYFQK